MRSDKEVAREVLRRAETIRRRRGVKMRRIYAACAAAACLAFIAGLSFALPAVDGGALPTGWQYGAAMFADGPAGLRYV
ncbi:MAG: hypothetical protein LBH39_02635 [Clostridiales Family XIII bacterium]|jgi:hypothetical protein|nr:hypothetical protein [Clostridiales Family XIII bacterium]